MRLRLEGWRVNHTTVERLYREEGLSLRRRERKKATAVPRAAAAQRARELVRDGLSMAGWPLADGSNA
jgi:transposase InsO family protein